MEDKIDKSFGSFLDWTVSEVVEWLQSLSLNGNYQRHFEENEIDGKTLLKFNQTLLQDQLNIADSNDRVTILQMITAMRADLMTNSSDKNAIIKMPRPSSAGSARSRHISATNIQSSDSSRNSTPTGDAVLLAYRKSTTRHHSLIMGPKVWNLRRHRSLDRLIESDNEDNSLNGVLSTRKLSGGSNSSRLVNILKEENSSLKKELDSYYQRVRRLHKIEQEVEQIRESHQLLEESTKRRERLENAMRAKLEHQLKKLKESNFQLEMELQTMRNNTPQSVTTEMADNKVKREIARRDSMIKRLIKQNKDSASVREKLQKDLQSTKTALEDIKKEEEVNAATSHERTDSSSDSPAGEQGTQLAEVYAKSIENLKTILTEMQSMSEKKEKIENKLRIQLTQELATLKQQQYANGVPQVDATAVSGANEKVAALEITIARLEHKCLQVVAERQMALDAATVPRDTAIARMKRTIAEQQDTIEELKQQKMNYMVQLYDANKKIADLENKKAILQLNVAEKDSLIQTLQQSYSEVDDDLWASHGGEMSPTIKALSPSPTVMGIPSPRSPNRAGSHDRLHSGTLVADVSDGTTRLVSSMGNLNGDCSSPTGKTRLGALNLAVATSINDSSPGQGKHTSSSVPNSPGVTHRLLHTTQNSAKTVKSHSAESAWIFSGMQREHGDKKMPKSSPSHKTHSPNRRMLKSFSADRHSPLADYSQDSGFGIFHSVGGTSCDSRLSNRDDSRHIPWQV